MRLFGIRLGPGGRSTLGPDAAAGFEAITAAMPLRHFEDAFHHSPRFGYVYLSVPKAACSTLKLTLQRMELDDASYQPRRIHAREGSPLAGPTQLGLARVQALLDDPAVLKFAFVRNPYTRLLSAYLDKIARRSPGRDRRLQILGFDPETRPRDLPFPLFLRRIAEQSDAEMDGHWRPQAAQLLLDRIDYGFLGRVESLDSDLARLDALLSGRLLPFYGLRARHGTGAQVLLRRHYDRDSRRLVRERFAADFTRFGYDPRFKAALATEPARAPAPAPTVSGAARP